MQLLEYLESFSSWIKSYHSTIPKLDKEIITKVFMTSGNKNLEYTILMATNTYDIGIDNPDIIFIIQWDISLFFDSIIQRLGRARRKGGQSTFIFFSLIWT